ncbi:hypothetical protein B0H14DRAFT_2640580 [Mycena olivaceomarginata]|nr:hypothetical protein B0H14DRAFT_2640580 [Mycena olivaceomarginata]
MLPRFGRSYTNRPLDSSPLAPSTSSPNSSRIIQPRRLSSKSRTSKSGACYHVESTHQAGFGVSSQLGDIGDDLQTAFLRTRLKLRVMRGRVAKKQRDKFNSSDKIDMDGDHKDKDSEKRASCASRIAIWIAKCTTHTFGSNFAEELQNWERELGRFAAGDNLTANSVNPEADEEVLAYLRQQEAEAAFTEFADISADDLASLGFSTYCNAIAVER